MQAINIDRMPDEEFQELLTKAIRDFIHTNISLNGVLYGTFSANTDVFRGEIEVYEDRVIDANEFECESFNCYLCDDEFSGNDVATHVITHHADILPVRGW